MRQIFKSIIILSVIFFSSCEQESSIILNERFDSNEIGWVEETTNHHSLDITGGKYVLQSKSINHSRTSSGPQNIGFLFELTEKYEIITSAKFVDGNDDMIIGLILGGATLEYQFSISKGNEIKIIEQDYNEEKPVVMACFVTKEPIIKENKLYLELKIEMEGTNFKFCIDNKVAAKGTVRSEFWHDMRLFVSKGKGEFNYLIINDLT